MGLFQSDHPDVAGMKGLHLFHFVLSNCSQRVRIGLEEKALAWTSHHVNLPANEHVNADYQRINPNGVVPTLVHDGQVVIESNDILFYLDEQFPEPALQPEDAKLREAMKQQIVASSNFQGVIKILSHELLFRPFRKIGQEELDLYEREHRDPALVAWLKDYAEEGPAWGTRVEEAWKGLEVGMRRLESALSENVWLSGESFGLADISWVVNYHRLIQSKVDLGAWPQFSEWGTRAVARPAFDAAVVRYAP